MEEKNRKNPFWNAKLTSEERLDWLLANMTLEEKITCMASTMPELPRFGIDMSYVGGGLLTVLRLEMIRMGEIYLSQLLHFHSQLA